MQSQRINQTMYIHYLHKKLLLHGFKVTSTEGLKATCATAIDFCACHAYAQIMRGFSIFVRLLK